MDRHESAGSVAGVNRSVWAVAAIVGLGLSACSSGSTATNTQTSASASATTASASPSPTVTRVPVEWGDGLNPPGMSQGVPNPTGWYTNAFGPRTKEKVIYLTFDDGPWPPYTEQILKLLAQHNAKATFFVVGQQARQYPQLITAEHEAGNAIGNHTNTHPQLTSLSTEQVTHELTATDKAVGADMGGCMRPPYGLVSQKVADAAGKLGLVPVLWTAHADDWDQPPVTKMISALKRGTEPGAVFLLHDGGGPRSHTVEAVKEMLPWWKQEGYSFGLVPVCAQPRESTTVSAN